MPEQASSEIPAPKEFQLKRRSNLPQDSTDFVSAPLEYLVAG